jgi:hypothetical protein
MLTIEFLIYQRDGQELSEETIKAMQLTYEELFCQPGGCEGAIQISTDGNLSNLLEDVLAALVKNLCFEANRELHETGRGIYYFHSYSAQVLLSLDDQMVKMEGDVVATSFYEFNEFAEGLYNCGRRFIELLRKIKAANEKNEKDRLALIQILETAKQEMDNQPPYKTR